MSRSLKIRRMCEGTRKPEEGREWSTMSTGRSICCRRMHAELRTGENATLPGSADTTRILLVGRTDDLKTEFVLGLGDRFRSFRMGVMSAIS